MPILTLHLLKLNKATDAQSFIHQLKQSTQIIVSSRPRHTVIHPSLLDSNLLATTNWDLLLLLQNSAPTEDPIPSTLRQSITEEYKLTTGIPSKLLATYSDRDAELKAKACSIPLTGSLDEILKGETKTTSQNLEVSPELLDFMRDVSKTHPGPVTMLNLLHFHHPDGKQNYFQYGQAFVPVAGKRGGSAKLVGNVVPPQGGDSRGLSNRPASDWWNEISIVHYPSIRHFCDMLAGKDYQAINEKYRLSALRDTFLLCTTEFDVEEVGGVKL